MCSIDLKQDVKPVWQLIHHPLLPHSLSARGDEAVAMQKQVTADRHRLPHQRNRSPSNER